MKQQHALLYTRACCLLITSLVGIDGTCGIFLGEVNVTDGVIHLIEVIFVVFIRSHALELGNHLSSLSVIGKHLTHGNTGIKLHFVWWVLTDNLLECLVGQILMTESSLYLTEEIILTGTLLRAHLVLHHLTEILCRILHILDVKVVVGIGVIPFFLCTPVDRVALHIADYVLCIIEPVLLDITLSQPCTSLAVDGWLGFI